MSSVEVIMGTPSGQHQHQHGSLKSLFEYPLMSALVERRTRRVARGQSITGPLSHDSTNKPEPLTPLEEAIFICVATGIVGITTHDGPLIKKNGTPELGTPFLNIVARTGSSADNAQATYFFMINDDGIFLLKHPMGQKALDTMKSLPPRWADWKEEDWIAAADACKTRVQKKRLDFPREWPYYLGWNAQGSNVAGSTVFFPVVDCTWQYINALLILCSEPIGKRPVIIDDWRTFQPSGAVERLAKIAGSVGIGEKIPYHIIGGLKRVREGSVNKESVAPLGFGGALRTDYECFFYFQNLMLLGQAMGLGGWIHGSVFPPYIFHNDPAKGWHGLGFRFQEPKQVSPMAPVPASQPNPVGIDGILEGLCPPYVKNMNEAVDKVIEMKYGAHGGSYGQHSVFSAPYKNKDDAKKYNAVATKYNPEAVAYTKEICNYLFDTYGRFPAHVDAFYTPGMWLQFSHLEMEYYDKYFDGAQYKRQAEHDKVWHGK